MNKDFFKRPTRMQFKFGELEKEDDPLGTRTFDPKFPVRPDQLRSGPLESQQFGEDRVFNPPRSGVSKPNGKQASIAGPSVDMAQAVGFRIGTQTKRRRFP